VVSTNIVGTNVTLTTNELNTMGLLWYPVEPQVTTNDLQGVAGRGDLLVVTGGAGTILASTNGTNWSVRKTGTTALLSSVESFPGGWVATGDNGTLLTSSDTTVWTPRALGTANWIYRVRYLAGRLIAVGQGGTILSSTNGLDWSAQASGTTRWLNDVTLVGGTCFVVGNQGTVLASTNGMNWVSIGTITGNSLFAAATYQGQLLTVGVTGSILRAQVEPKLDPIEIDRYAHSVTNGVAQDLFLFVGQPDQRFTLDAGTVFTDWKAGPTLEFIDSSGTLLWLRSSTDLRTNQFFRATLPP
jgi:hypothetical protein